MFANATNGFEFLQSVDQEIHVEVLKLYPDAELPSFRNELLSEHVLQMTTVPTVLWAPWPTD